MKRKGARVVSTVRESASAAPPPPEVVNTTIAPSAATPVAVDIFGKFQSRRDDFEVEWLMMQDDPADASAKPPMNAEVTDKLRQHQRMLGATRRARQTQSQLTSAVRPDADFEAAVAAVAGEAPRRPRRESPKDSTSDEDVRPEGEDEVSGPEADGLTGEYLTFLSTTTGKADARTLQATVSLGRRAGRSPGSDSSSAGPSTSAVVPLWSVERIRRYGAYCAESALVALHQEVTDLLDFLRPTQGEVSVRRFIEMEVASTAKKLWPHCEPIVYGSVYTHLLLPLSDVDITLANVPVPPEEALPLLAKAIAQANLCEEASPQVILKTKVPLVKFQHRGSLIDVDISVEAQDGKRNSDMVLALMKQFPEAQPLIIVIKYFLQQRGMHEPFHGGLGSYATVLMVLSFLQNHPIHTTRPHERSYTGLGKLLVDYFRYYGQCWNYQKCGISVEDGGTYFRRSDGGMFSPTSPTAPRSVIGGPPQAMIEDPGNPSNNAASSLRNLHMITSVFTHAYLSLTAVFPPVPVEERSPDAQDIAKRPTLLSRILHVDAATVQRRQSIAATYSAMCRDQPEHMEEVRLYRRAEDLPMLEGRGAVAGRSARSTAHQSSLAELRRLATLTAAAARGSPTSPSEPRKRSHEEINVDCDSRSSSQSSTSSSGDSNASSVLKDVSRPSRRRKQKPRP